MPSNRRSFLLGRRAHTEPLQLFKAALSRSARGRLVTVPNLPTNAVMLLAADTGDIVTARALCAQHGVQMQLIEIVETVASRANASQVEGVDAISYGGSQADRDTSTGGSDKGFEVSGSIGTLMVDTTLLNGIVTMPSRDAAPPLWRAGPGARLGELAACGLTQFEGLPPDQSLQSWLIDTHACVSPGHCDATGVLGADVLFADGTIETLGPFGAKGTRPLKSARVQALVPALFQLSQCPDAVLLRAQPVWLAQCRLDALSPNDPNEVNLAQVFLGSQGRYGWMLQCLLQARPAKPGRLDRGDPFDAQIPAVPTALLDAAQRLDLDLRNALDPARVFKGCRVVLMTE